MPRHPRPATCAWEEFDTVPLESVAHTVRIQCKSNLMVIAMGKKSEHWHQVRRQFPGIRNCCIDVTKPFRLEEGESTGGSGFDACTRQRIQKKPAWSVLWEIALHMVNTFGVLILLCNHGRHRSLSLAYEVACHERCVLVSILDRSVPSVMAEISPRLGEYITTFSRREPHPISGIWLCEYAFNGDDWSTQKDPGSQGGSGRYLSMERGDVIVRIFKDEVESEGWFFGIMIDRQRLSLRAGSLIRTDEGWFPPKFVVPLREWFYGQWDPFSKLVVPEWDRTLA